MISNVCSNLLRYFAEFRFELAILYSNVAHFIRVLSKFLVCKFIQIQFIGSNYKGIFEREIHLFSMQMQFIGSKCQGIF